MSASPPPTDDAGSSRQGLVATGVLGALVVLAALVGTTDSGHIDASATTPPPATTPTIAEGPDPPFENLLSPHPYAAGASSRAATVPAETTTTIAPAAPATSSPPPYRTTTTAKRPFTPSSMVGAVWPVANIDQWNQAVVAARPGDTIRLVATIYQPLQYRGSLYQPERQRGTDGTPARPITITADPGVWIDPNDIHNNKGALDILHTTNVNVIGVRVRHSQFGIRIIHSSGTAASPLVVSGNTVTDIGHAGIHVGGDWDTHAPSSHVRVEGNRIVRTGQLDPEFGEGIYLGFGAREWVDKTSNITVVGNDISFTGAEGVDIKPGVRRVLVEGNTIHDLSPIAGGAITACYVGTAPDPEPGQSADIVLRRNRIWNMDLDDRNGSNGWAIWVGHGGVTVEANAVWGLRADPASVRAVRVRSPIAFGSFPIRIINNLFWTATGWVAEGSPSGASLVRASGNRGPAGAAGVEAPLAPRSGAPAVGTGGPADSGAGPGSALGF